MWKLIQDFHIKSIYGSRPVEKRVQIFFKRSDIEWKKYDLVSQPVKSNINWLYNENLWWNFLKRWRIILYTSFLSILSCASELKGENIINVLYVKDCLCNKNILVCFCLSGIMLLIYIFFMIWIANDKFIFDFLRFDS